MASHWAEMDLIAGPRTGLLSAQLHFWESGSQIRRSLWERMLDVNARF